MLTHSAELLTPYLHAVPPVDLKGFCQTEQQFQLWPQEGSEASLVPFLSCFVNNRAWIIGEMASFKN